MPQHSSHIGICGARTLSVFVKLGSKQVLRSVGRYGPIKLMSRLEEFREVIGPWVMNEKGAIGLVCQQEKVGHLNESIAKASAVFWFGVVVIKVTSHDQKALIGLVQGLVVRFGWL